MFIYHENQSAQNITKLLVTMQISIIYIFRVAGLFVAYFKICHPEFALTVGLIPNEAAADDTCELSL